MYLKFAEFKHEEEDLVKACGATDQQMITVRERIFFHTMRQYNTVYTKYIDMTDDEEVDSSSIPSHLRTKTGILEDLVNEVENRVEYDLCLLMFTKHASVVSDIFKLHMMMEKAKTENLSVYKQMCRKIKEADDAILEKAEEAGKEQKDPSVITMMPTNILKRIDLYKKSDDNFENYLKMYNDLNIENVFSDIDDLLGKVFDV